MSKTFVWGIIGTGRIAGIFARGIAESQTGKLAAIGSRKRATAEKFGELWNVPHCYGSYEEVLADKDVQAVYIATPHPMHAEWAIKAAEAGKHILCEKPIALNYSEAAEIIEAARRNDVFLMEAFMYRCHPQTEKLVELIRTRVIGDVRVIQATFSFHTSPDPESRLLNNALGGGGILDVGCYCTSMARLIAGAVIGRSFVEPIKVVGCGHIGEVTGVDEYAIASLTFPGDIVAQLFSGVRVDGENVVRIFGTQGSILVPSPWTPRSGDALSIIVQKSNESRSQEISVENTVGLYALEADTVARNLAARQAPAMSWDDTLGNMQTLDLWRAAIGMVYDIETPKKSFK